MATVLLSEIPDDTMLSYEDYHETVTALELRQMIAAGEVKKSDHTWIVTEPRVWKPDAKYMIDQYIENEYQDMYEDWDERANDCITPEHIAKIQAVLDEAFSDGHATQYWMLDGPDVIIDEV
ncbi:hypothetical protein [Paenibacillus sp. FSL R7-0128]|uniref:hypothetical protein n=1 Tax=Paenibacillus sp. FSL R7-0128 TaxID=2954529 RepID=UPI0030F6CA0C